MQSQSQSLTLGRLEVLKFNIGREWHPEVSGVQKPEWMAGANVKVLHTGRGL